jgi:hypothetical protein
MQKIASALVKAQRSFAPALKTNTNPHFRSKYVALDGCIEAVLDALNANGIALLQPTHECESGVMVETLFLHESGESISGGRLHVPAAKNDAQGYGSALTYARRYSLMAACGIAPEDDDGNAASKSKGVKAVRITATDGAVQRVSTQRLVELDGLALDVTEAVRINSDAAHAAALCGDVTDADEKVYLWSLLPSDVRSAIKKVSTKEAA